MGEFRKWLENADELSPGPVWHPGQDEDTVRFNNALEQAERELSLFLGKLAERQYEWISDEHDERLKQAMELVAEKLQEAAEAAEAVEKLL